MEICNGGYDGLHPQIIYNSDHYDLGECPICKIIKPLKEDSQANLERRLRVAAGIK